MVEGDVRDDGERRDDVRRVEPSAEAGFPNHEVAFLLREKFQSDDGGEFKKGSAAVPAAACRRDACATL